MIERIFPATEDQLEPVQSFIDGELEQYDCPPKAQIQLAVAVEEIFINIVRYAYHPEVGLATVRCSVGGDPLQVTIQFLDNGKPFNPLEKEDADITLSAEERDIGGLGILMVSVNAVRGGKAEGEKRPVSRLPPWTGKKKGKRQQKKGCRYGIIIV